MMLFFKLINSSFKRNLKVYIPYLISMTMLVAINYIFKAVEINRSLKNLPSAAVTKALMQTGSTFMALRQVVLIRRYESSPIKLV